MMDAEQYRTERLQNQIDWYSTNSTYCKRWFKSLRITELVVAALIIPVSCYVPNDGYGIYFIPILGFIIVIVSAWLAICKYHENWIEYRTTSETLKQEKYLFITGTDPYNLDNRFNLLVQRCESIISKENSQWISTIKTANKT